MLPYYKEEEKSRLHRELSQKAIELAVQGRWEETEAVNRDIIERFPTDVEAYNRIGRTLIELGDLVNAKEAYAKALELKPDNVIAKKNLARLANLPELTTTAEIKETKVKNRSGTRAQGIAPDLFVAEMGKAGIAKLRNVASGDTPAKLVVGDRVWLRVEGQRLIVENEQEEYVAEVEPKYALRLIKLINGGNRYDAAILSIGKDEGRVIIKEVYQHPTQAGYHLPFPAKGVAALRSYAKEGFIRHSIRALEGEIEEPYEAKEIEYPLDEEESELEGFIVLEDNTEASSEEEIK